MTGCGTEARSSRRAAQNPQLWGLPQGRPQSSPSPTNLYRVPLAPALCQVLADRPAPALRHAPTWARGRHCDCGGSGCAGRRGLGESSTGLGSALSAVRAVTRDDTCQCDFAVLRIGQRCWLSGWYGAIFWKRPKIWSVVGLSSSAGSASCDRSPFISPDLRPSCFIAWGHSGYLSTDTDSSPRGAGAGEEEEGRRVEQTVTEGDQTAW